MANGQTNIAGGKALVGTAQPSDVRMGMTYPDGKVLRNGTLDLTNLLPENIKSGVTIGGVAGLFKGNGLKTKKVKVPLPKWGYFTKTGETYLCTFPANTICATLSSGGTFHLNLYKPKSENGWKNAYYSIKIVGGGQVAHCFQAAYISDSEWYDYSGNTTKNIYSINFLNYGMGAIGYEKHARWNETIEQMLEVIQHSLAVYIVPQQQNHISGYLGSSSELYFECLVLDV